ncbi:MAG: Uma2 family endonuclease [Fimbriimonadales bacterium]|nr:Uma2 family endonuclease [Fimbriimonadales bacterium]
MALSQVQPHRFLTEEQRAKIKRAIAELRQLLPLYEQTHDPELYAKIEQLSDLLPAEDGIPMEFFWHSQQMFLLIELVRVLWYGKRTDYVVGGNNFIYYSLDQAEAVVDDRRDAYRGPDFFVITGVDPHKPREKWVGWLEDYKYPDLIVELLSDSTADNDRRVKKQIYQDIFKTREYFWYDAYSGEFEGFELVEGVYQPKRRNERGWMWSDVLEVWVGVLHSDVWGREFPWLRLIYPDGTPVPTTREWYEYARQQATQAELIAQAERQRAEAERQRAEAERQRAEAERQRAEQAETQLERLRARLRAMGIDPDTIGE